MERERGWRNGIRELAAFEKLDEAESRQAECGGRRRERRGEKERIKGRKERRKGTGGKHRS